MFLFIQSTTIARHFKQGIFIDLTFI